ncbi:MAG: J domain-containing protein [Oscillospiraceae bacterium]|nr:J domain-containing protein [Oscillospiraceae bacterium]
MADPYKTLGVPPGASDDEVKSAYRELARKYHPDRYADNPLADLAAEKMKEVNDAYDQINSMRKGTGQSNYSGWENNGASQFSDIRRLISARRVTEAEELLDGTPVHLRDAEWHFLKASVQYTRGWLDQAYGNFARAHQMDPGNREYQAAFNQMQWQRQTGRAPGTGYHTQGGYGGGCSVCDFCTALYCTSCCCDCMSGC